MKDNNTAKQVIFSGRVQGVGFRFTTINIANRYDVNGYVRNCPDGTVELLAQGPKKDVDSLIADIEKAFKGNISDKKVTKTSPSDQHTEFRLAY